MRWGAEVFHGLKSALKKAGHNTNVGDEGGFAPNLPSAEAALDFVVKAIEAAGFKPGQDIAIGLDAAASEFFKDGAYHYEGEGKVRSIQEQAEYLAKLASAYPIVTIEDGNAENDWDGWKITTDLLGKKVQIVGDDIFVTNVAILGEGIKKGVGQFHPDQGQPDRHAERDARRRRYGPSRRLYGGYVAPFGRDRGFHHRRSRSGHQLRTDQDGLAGPLRPDGQVQPVDPHRGRAGQAGGLRRARRAQGPRLTINEQGALREIPQRP